MHLLGHSWGADVVSLFAAQHPEKVGRLVLSALGLSPDPNFAVPSTEFSELSTDRLWSGFDPRVADKTMMSAYVQEAMKFRSFPRGADMDRVPVADAQKIVAPTMIIMGAVGSTHADQPTGTAWLQKSCNPRQAIHHRAGCWTWRLPTQDPREVLRGSEQVVHFRLS